LRTLAKGSGSARAKRPVDAHVQTSSRVWGSPESEATTAVLEQANLSARIGRKEYEEELEELQLGLVKLQRKVVDKGRRIVIGFEGWDAAGKGGAIKRLLAYMDPRGYEVHPVGAPSSLELEHHYLRRFWQRLPRRGIITIFDRTWYGRVVVERIEGFASEEEWQRGYREINEFERMLVDDGYCLIKFFMHLSDEEQLDRFEKRRDDPFKSWKLTDDDWRNRKKRPDYLAAYEDMFAKTSTDCAPWTIVSAESKRNARLTVLRTVTEALRRACKG